MKLTFLNLVTVVILMVAGVFYFADAQSLGEPGRDNNKPNPLKNVCFGEQHMHTQNSFDAYTVGVRGTWAEA